MPLERPDLAFATNELCRRMSAPTQSDLEALRRLARYLLSVSRVVCDFEWQPVVDLEVFFRYGRRRLPWDTTEDIGRRCPQRPPLGKHWSSTQKKVTLSSGEAELCGIMKGTTEALRIPSLGRDLDIEMAVHVQADFAAAIGICRRSGTGTVGRLVVGQLWVSGRAAQRRRQIL